MKFLTNKGRELILGSVALPLDGRDAVYQTAMRITVTCGDNYFYTSSLSYMLNTSIKVRKLLSHTLEC